jgi:glycogen debranching enzyme
MRDAEIVRVVGSVLLTPLGLRSLAPGSPGYRPVHRGGPAERDSAYHQGTVWPWLIGPYTEAVSRSADGSARGSAGGSAGGSAMGSATLSASGSATEGARPLDDVRGVLEGLIGHLRDWGLGSVSETADADPPHAATGCPFQAWSVAEFLRIKCLLDS